MNPRSWFFLVPFLATPPIPPPTSAQLDDAPPARQEAKRLDHVLLITLDTTRADRLGCYGYAKAETPTLDQLARDGVLVERALATAPITLPSHTSILTGRYPIGHGVHDNGIFKAAPELVTLAERLKAAGYATAAFVSSQVVASQYGLAQGFDRYDEQLVTSSAGGLSRVERRAAATVNAALAWMEQAPLSPWFVWLHLFDPHRPFDAPPAFAKRFEDPYDAEIAYIDQQLKRFLQRWGKERLARTAVIVTADHGEGLGEHDELSHGLFLYDSTMRVPLLLRHPSFGAGKRLAGQVSHVDLVPTLLDLLQLPPAAGEAPLDGVSLLPALRSEKPEAWNDALLETYLPWYGHGLSPLEGLSDRRAKLIDGPDRELYLWREDPGEQHDRADDEAALTAALHERIVAWRDGHDPLASKAAGDLDPEERERLAALGYTAGDAATPPDRATLAHPRTYAEIFNARALALDYVEANRLDEAAATLRACLERFPRDGSVHSMMGHVRFLQKQWPEAIDHLRRSIALRPDEFGAALELAHALAETGDLRGALDATDHAIDHAPTYTRAYLMAAEFAGKLGDTGRTRGYLEKARATCKPGGEQAKEIDARLQALGSR